jgi:hypothetical protein
VDYFFPNGSHRLPRGEERLSEFLGLRLDTARDVHRVAHRRELTLQSVTDVADDQGPVVQPEPQMELATEVTLGVPVQVGHPGGGLQSCADGAAAAATSIARLEREPGHEPVAHVLVDETVIFQDSLADRRVIPVQEMDHVVRGCAAAKAVKLPMSQNITAGEASWPSWPGGRSAAPG